MFISLFCDCKNLAATGAILAWVAAVSPVVSFATCAFVLASIAQEFGGRFHLRFDDTNPEKEEQQYIDAIIEDVRWLGFDWGDRLFFASDYFQQLYDWAEQLVQAGHAYYLGNFHANSDGQYGLFENKLVNTLKTRDDDFEKTTADVRNLYPGLGQLEFSRVEFETMQAGGEAGSP